jgi:hypothetical protein
VIAEQIREAIGDVEGVKRWVDNDVAVGDEAIRVHADALERALAKLEGAADTAERLAEELDANETERRLSDAETKLEELEEAVQDIAARQRGTKGGTS